MTRKILKTRILIAAIIAVVNLTADTMAFAEGPAPIHEITGHVTDSNKEPVPYANVILLNAKDSTFVQGATTDENGRFIITAPMNKGILNISCIGYETKFINVTGEPVNVSLSENAQLLGEVTAIGQKPKTKLTGNSMVTNIEGTVLSQSGTAKEMLSKVPGMTQKGDDLEVIGRGKPIFYINGRIVQDLDELKRMRSEEIKDVEVITNPGAMYNATVTAVVRIKTVRHQGDGFGFDANIESVSDLRYGYYDPSGTLNLRYRHNSFDLFGMVNYWEWSNVNDTYPRQWSYIKRNGTITCIEQRNNLRYDWTGRGMNYNIGFNWQPSDNHSIGMRIERNDRFDGGYEAWINNWVIERVLESSEEAVEQYSNSTQSSDERQPYNWQGNAYYNGSVGKLGIDLNVDFLTNKQTDNVSIKEYNDVETEMSSVSPTRNTMLADKLVFTYPIWRGQLMAGTEMSFVQRKSSYSLTGSLLPSTSSRVKENNIAAFAEYAFMLPKVGNFSAGLRYEHVGFKYTDYINASGSMSRYTDDLFPSISWANQWGTVQTALSYSYKTERPNYWMLNESMIYINPYTLQTGDPKLKNVKIHSLGANARWKWSMLFMNYERRDNALSQWSQIYNDEGVILIKNINLPAPVRSFTAGINLSPTWGVYNANWTIGLQKFMYHQTLADPREATGSREVKYNNPIGFFTLNNAFRLGHSWLLEANMNITTQGDVMNYRLTSATYNLSFAVQKCWLKNDALCLRAAIYDVLQRSGESVEMDCGYYIINQNARRSTHNLNVSLRYTFNAAQNKYKGTGAGKEAAGRMGK